MKYKLGIRLAELRKENGFSQEEIAEILAVSRQAVSNWERGESSPDTENLIELAKIYNITIDELIFEKKTMKSTTKKQNKTENHTKNVHIGFDGIKVTDAENNTSINIGFKGIHVVDSNSSTDVHIDKNGVIVNNEEYHKNYWIDMIMPLVAVTFYFIYSLCKGDAWHYSWLILVLIPIIHSLYDSFKHKEPERFAYPVLVISAYIAYGLLCKIWHPSWLYFLSIPFYYCACECIKKHPHKNTDTEMDENEQNNKKIAKALALILCISTIIFLGLISFCPSVFSSIIK